MNYDYGLSINLVESDQNKPRILRISRIVSADCLAVDIERVRFALIALNKVLQDSLL